MSNKTEYAHYVARECVGKHLHAAVEDDNYTVTVCDPEKFVTISTIRCYNDGTIRHCLSPDVDTKLATRALDAICSLHGHIRKNRKSNQE